MEATGEATTTDAAVDRDVGRVLVGVDVAGTALFAVTAVAEAILLDRWSQVLGVAVALVLFAVAPRVGRHFGLIPIVSQLLLATLGLPLLM